MREKFKQMRERFNSESGFTLIELMATLAILALIVVIAVPAIGNIIANADEQSDRTTEDMIERAAEIAYVDSLTEEGPNLGNITASDLVEEGFLDLTAEQETRLGAIEAEHQGNGDYEFVIPAD